MYGLLTISAIAFTLFLIFEYRVSWLSWFALVAICVFFIAFPLGPEIFTPLVCSELWSVGPRKAALSVTQHIGWWVDVVIQFCFPTLLPLAPTLSSFSLLPLPSPPSSYSFTCPRRKTGGSSKYRQDSKK
nr:solute carrier family 2, facilitated glucose transporter member 2-like isoform X2 [Lytechinus pictus]